MSSQNSIANASMSSNTVGASSTSTSAVRSRPRRLVSFMDDEDDTSTNNGHYAYHDSQPFTSGLSTTLLPEGNTRSRGATPSPLSSRGASPLPMRHPSRVTESEYRSRNESTSLGWNGSSRPAQGGSDFLDSPWSSLQNLASSVLGSNTGRNAADNSTKKHPRRKPSRSDAYTRSTPRANLLAWGPSAPASPDIGSGTKEERQALVQAKKREALLLADSDLISGRNFRHKKRDSGDYSDQVADPDHDEDALAYIHHVQASDSITGVTIKYGCQAAVFRKANGFWPNDNIQSRNTVLLPVDACTVKGRPIGEKERVDLLGCDSEDGTGSCIAPAADHTDRPATERRTSGHSESETNKIWKHESWVQIEGFPTAIEIGRVPRRALGFFPRTRRKSISYTDAEPLSVISSQAPTRSPSPSVSAQLNSSQTTLPGTRPLDGDPPKPSGSRPTRPKHRRQRSSIHLSGTGVGTLDRTSAAPGPALDGLSKFFSQHIPQLAPPPPLSDPRRPSFGSEGTMSNASTGLENIGGALEGWVRKVATRAKAGFNDMQGSPTLSASGRGRSPGVWGMNDLIELDDASEGRRSPSVLGMARRPEPVTSSSSSSFRPTASTSVTSRPRATGSGPSAYGVRTKDD
ncbi:uncharacterized protein N7503_002601 [Penicillium pulvis]|uniref:uncharacterized protein n=1 Tax=Penicillium pulvis TaxID=1562058 RepID=UPI00254901ED|nr:uncharacterized protein N7503_002601 [Penicillium pulvis]KAJ5810383.1 hypothetical protein N7503_002601 [Penicillium pulvis]